MDACDRGHMIYKIVCRIEGTSREHTLPRVLHDKSRATGYPRVLTRALSGFSRSFLSQGSASTVAITMEARIEALATALMDTMTKDRCCHCCAWADAYVRRGALTVLCSNVAGRVLLTAVEGRRRSVERLVVGIVLRCGDTCVGRRK